MTNFLNEMLSHNQEALEIGINALQSCVEQLNSDNDFATNFMLLKNVLAVTQEQLNLMIKLYGLKEVEI